MKGFRYVRVRLDFTIVLDKEIESNIIVGPREVDRVRYGIYAVLTGDKRVIGIAPGMKTSTGFDKRRRDPQHNLR